MSFESHFKFDQGRHHVRVVLQVGIGGVTETFQVVHHSLDQAVRITVTDQANSGAFEQRLTLAGTCFTVHSNFSVLFRSC